MYVRILAAELGPLGVHVVNVATGSMGTEMVEAGGEMDEIPDGEFDACEMWVVTDELICDQILLIR